MPVLMKKPTSRPPVPKIEPARAEKLAINVVDCDRIDPLIRGMLLAGKLDLSAPIRTDPDRVDEAAVAFSCDLLSAACILDTLRSHDRAAGDYPTRCYLQKSGGAWTKLSGSSTLSLVVGDRVVLNPAIFPPNVRPEEIVAKPPERVEL